MFHRLFHKWPFNLFLSGYCERGVFQCGRCGELLNWYGSPELYNEKGRE